MKQCPYTALCDQTRVREQSSLIVAVAQCSGEGEAAAERAGGGGDVVCESDLAGLGLWQNDGVCGGSGEDRLISRCDGAEEDVANCCFRGRLEHGSLRRGSVVVQEL